MVRCLVVVDSPVHGDAALAELESLAREGATFHIVVPAAPLSEDQRAFVRRERAAGEHDDPEEVVAARWRLRDAALALRSAGLEAVNGWVGTDDLVQIVERAVDADDFQTVVVVTGPIGLAGWVRLDLASRIERRVDQPVIVVEVEPVGA